MGDWAENPRFIETLPRRGYRFIHPIQLAPSFSPDRVSKARLRRYGLIALLAGAVAAALILTFALDATWLLRRFRTANSIKSSATPPRIESIAVLPFENLSGDAAQEYFADGMTEELVTDLAKISPRRVISRTSVMRFKGSTKPLPEIARELNVDAIVEGTVQRSGNRVHVTANLLYAPTDRHLWAESYESDLEDVLILQGKVARSIAGQIGIKLTLQERDPFGSTRSVNAEAYQAYLAPSTCLWRIVVSPVFP